MVKPKKHLGQHFLTDLSVAKRVADSLTGHGGYTQVLEVGPGTGALTQFLLEREEFETTVIEVDGESVEHLEYAFPTLGQRILRGDFLKINLDDHFTGPIAIVGNYPYNISSQILFSVFENRDRIPESAGMFQKEVAQRVAAGPGSKTYGILSVLLQAFYDIEYLFTVDEHVFNPPPKVKSAVIRLKRNDVKKLACDEKAFVKVVKAAFNQRRKTLRNSVKGITTQYETTIPEQFSGLRPEQMSVQDFIALTASIMPS